MENIMGDVTHPHTVQKRLHWVKIKKSPQECVYIKIDIPSQMFMKWYWFFRYRAALVQIQNPRANVVLESGSSIAEIEQEEMIKHINRQIKIQESSIKKMFANRILAIENWHELLPIQDHQDYKKFIDKLEDSIIRLFNLKLAVIKVKKKGWSMQLWNEHYK